MEGGRWKGVGGRCLRDKSSKAALPSHAMTGAMMHAGTARQRTRLVAGVAPDMNGSRDGFYGFAPSFLEGSSDSCMVRWHLGSNNIILQFSQFTPSRTECRCRMQRLTSKYNAKRATSRGRSLLILSQHSLMQTPRSSIRSSLRHTRRRADTLFHSTRVAR